MNRRKKKPNLNLLPTPDVPTCETQMVHLENVRSCQSEIVTTAKAQQMAEFFAVLADPNRLRLLSALASQELCVCDLAALTKMTQSAVSHQLRLLKAMRLVSYRREGRNVYYGLTDNHVIDLYRGVAAHLEDSPV